MGDDIQAIKAGILEIADVFVINKADRPGADRVAADLDAMMALAPAAAAPAPHLPDHRDDRRGDRSAARRPRVVRRRGRSGAEGQAPMGAGGVALPHRADGPLRPRRPPDAPAGSALRGASSPRSQRDGSIRTRRRTACCPEGRTDDLRRRSRRHRGQAASTIALSFWRDALGMAVRRNGVRADRRSPGRVSLRGRVARRAARSQPARLAGREVHRQAGGGDSPHHLSGRRDPAGARPAESQGCSAPGRHAASRRDGDEGRVPASARGGRRLDRAGRERPAATAGSSGGIGAGDPVLVYLRDPHEKLWGVLRERDASGLTVQGLDLASFDAWTAQVERGEEGIAPSVLFLPMARVERVLLDRGTPSLPSLSDGFLRAPAARSRASSSRGHSSLSCKLELTVSRLLGYR